MRRQRPFRGAVLTRSNLSASISLLTCCSKQDTFNNAVTRGQLAGKKVVLAGCVPQGTPNGRVTSNLSIVGVQQIDRVVEVVSINPHRNAPSRFVAPRSRSSDESARYRLRKL